MLDIIQEIKKRRCPQCGEEQSLDIAAYQYRVVCRACKSQRIDPFVIGPWSEKEYVFDTHDGDVVSFYLTEKNDDPPIMEPDPNWIDFYRQLFHGQSKRVVKQHK